MTNYYELRVSQKVHAGYFLKTGICTSSLSRLIL